MEKGGWIRWKVSGDAWGAGWWWELRVKITRAGGIQEKLGRVFIGHVEIGHGERL